MSAEESAMAFQPASALQIEAKLRDDLLLPIKRKEHETLDAIIRDPAKQRALLRNTSKLGKEREERDGRHQYRRDRHPLTVNNTQSNKTEKKEEMETRITSGGRKVVINSGMITKIGGKEGRIPFHLQL